MSSPEKMGSGGAESGPLVSVLKKRSEMQEKKSPKLGYTGVRNMIATRIQNAIGLNLNQDVKQYIDVHDRRVMPYLVRRVVNPSEFYMEFDSIPAPYKYSQWFPEMQRFYESKRNQEKLKVVKNLPIVARCYACKDFNDGKWYRVRLHKAKPSGALRVYYVDLCKTQDTTIDNLLELDPQFSFAPAQIFRCYLADVLPLGQAWSEDACEVFKKIVQNKVFLGVVLERSSTLVAGGLPDFFLNLGIVLLETVPGTRTPLPDVCTVNAQMVEAHFGFGVSFGVSAACQHTTGICGYVPSLDVDHLSLDSLDNATTDQVPVENGNLGENSEEFMSRDQDMEEKEDDEESLAESVSDKYLRTSSGLTFEEAELEGEQAFYQNTTVAFPAQFASRLAEVNVVDVKNPSFIIVHLKSKVEELRAMQQVIEQSVENEEWLTNGYPGMFVACHWYATLLNKGKKEHDTEEYFWYRGIIVSADFEDDPYYMVLLVDYGHMIRCESKYVRQLPVQFHEIPSFAVRIHLDGENLEPAVERGCASGWTNEAIKEFKDYISKWEAEDPHYLIYRPRNAQVFDLDDFCQPFHYEDGKWVPVRVDENVQSHFQIINEMSDHPLVFSLYESFGVELHYEIYHKGAKTWCFKTVLDLLIDRRFLVKRKSYKTYSRHHIEIIGSARSTKHVERLPPKILSELLKKRHGYDYSARILEDEGRGDPRRSGKSNL